LPRRQEIFVPAPIVALLLALHGLVHASFVSPAPPKTANGPEWPFDLGRSVLLTPLGLDAASTRVVGVALLAVVLVGYLVAAATALGLGQSAWFAPAVGVASVASVALLALFFHPWLVLGFAIDAVLLWAVAMKGWVPA
jgi:hypothetical protein